MTNADCKAELPLCQCGCGRRVSMSAARPRKPNRFLVGHTRKLGSIQATKDYLLSKCTIDETTGCWNWNGRRIQRADGTKTYGLFKRNGACTTAHRAAYAAFNGIIGDGMNVCHSCDNQLCINPSHLWLGTQQENIDDMMKKGRHSSVTMRKKANV